MSFRFPIALVLSILCLAAPAWADFQTGLDAHNRGDYATALREWRPLAEQGDASAQFNLGALHHNGQGAPQDYVLAYMWYNLAAPYLTGDRYASEWVREQFSQQGISYRHSERNKSELYLEALPLFAQGNVDLLEVPPLAMELMQLERRTARSGRDSIDHAPGGHDDHANACCGVLALLEVQTRHALQVVQLRGL